MISSSLSTMNQQPQSTIHCKDFSCLLKLYKQQSISEDQVLIRHFTQQLKLLRGNRLYDSQSIKALTLRQSINVKLFLLLVVECPSENNLTSEPGIIPPPLPPSVEAAYRKKCIQLKQRLNEIESGNDESRTRIQRLNRAIQKSRLERAFLLEQLAKRTSTNVEDSEGSPSPPPTVCYLSIYPL